MAGSASLTPLLFHQSGVPNVRHSKECPQLIVVSVSAQRRWRTLEARRNAGRAVGTRTIFVVRPDRIRRNGRGARGTPATWFCMRGGEAGKQGMGGTTEESCFPSGAAIFRPPCLPPLPPVSFSSFWHRYLIFAFASLSANLPPTLIFAEFRPAPTPNPNPTQTSHQLFEH